MHISWNLRIIYHCVVNKVVENIFSKHTFRASIFLLFIHKVYRKNVNLLKAFLCLGWNIRPGSLIYTIRKKRKKKQKKRVFVWFSRNWKMFNQSKIEYQNTRNILQIFPILIVVLIAHVNFHYFYRCLNWTMKKINENSSFLDLFSLFFFVEIWFSPAVCFTFEV